MRWSDQLLDSNKLKEAAKILKGMRNQLGGINQDSNQMGEEEDAKKATNHEVFFDDKFPIEKRAAATEILIKAKVVTGSLRNMVNISGISVITIILQKVVSIFTSRANMK